MLLDLYRAATRLGGPLIEAELRRRVRRQKEDPQRLGERLGRAGAPRPAGRLVWVHAASVGESLSVLPLVDALLARWPDLQVLVTTGTLSSARLLERRLPARARHQFAPIDRPAAVRRFLAHWRPDAALLVESELWPNLILETRARDVPMALVNARMSDRSYRRWQRLGGVAARLLGSFTLCLAQSGLDRDRFRALGARDVRAPGNLKLAAPPLAADDAALAALDEAVGTRPVWLAASTQPGEEEQILEVHRGLIERFPALLTVIAPRHPDRGDGIADLMRDCSVTFARRSAGALPGPGDGVYLADTLGELGLLYRIAAVALIGGSLVPHGGQNPLEAARLGCPPLFGPHTENFREITAALEAKGAAQRVAGAAELALAVGDLLRDAAAREAFAERARAAAESEGRVLAATLAALTPLLERALGARHARS